VGFNAENKKPTFSGWAMLTVYTKT